MTPGTPGGRSIGLGRSPALLTAVILAGCATGGMTPALTPTSADAPFVAGYHVYWAGDAWRDYPFEALDELFFFELEADSAGHFLDRHDWPGGWREMTRTALDHGVQVTPTVSMHDPEAFRALFARADRVETLVGSILSLLDEVPEASGVHLDFEVFEPVDGAVRDGFTAFVVELATELRTRHPGRALSAFVLAFDDDDVYNERAIAAAVDYVVVQGYDFHSSGSPNAGPVGGLTGWGRLNWMEVLRRFDAFGVPRRRIVMSMPLYGYEWPVADDTRGASTRGPGRTVPWMPPADVRADLPRARQRVETHGALRDEESGTPWYRFEADDGWWQGWFDDPRSLAARYRFVRDEGLGGIALFPLAYGDDSVWTGLREAFGR